MDVGSEAEGEVKNAMGETNRVEGKRGDSDLGERDTDRNEQVGDEVMLDKNLRKGMFEL